MENLILVLLVDRWTDNVWTCKTSNKRATNIANRKRDNQRDCNWTLLDGKVLNSGHYPLSSPDFPPSNRFSSFPTFTSPNVHDICLHINKTTPIKTKDEEEIRTSERQQRSFHQVKAKRAPWKLHYWHFDHKRGLKVDNGDLSII